MPPRIFLAEPLDGVVTNRFSLMVTGHVEDDTYAAAIAINGQDLFIELAAARLPFSTEVALQDGANSIEIVAASIRRAACVATPDRAPGPPRPPAEPYGVDQVGIPPHQQARLQGVVFDHSRIIRFSLAGQQMSWSGETPWSFARSCR